MAKGQHTGNSNDVAYLILLRTLFTTLQKAQKYLDCFVQLIFLVYLLYMQKILYVCLVSLFVYVQMIFVMNNYNIIFRDCSEFLVRGGWSFSGKVPVKTHTPPLGVTVKFWYPPPRSCCQKWVPPRKLFRAA